MPFSPYTMGQDTILVPEQIKTELCSKKVARSKNTFESWFENRWFLKIGLIM